MKQLLSAGYVVSILFANSILFGQTPTVGLIEHSNSSLDNGYVLFTPMPSKKTYLIDKCGKEIHSWTSTKRPGLSVYLLNDGNLLRTGCADDTFFTEGGTGGIIEKMDWNSNILWSYKISDNSTHCQHHDIKQLSNGNILAIVWELKTKSEAIWAGRDTNLLGSNLYNEKIVELQPIGQDSATIVWEWNVWDHLVQNFDSTKNNWGNIYNPNLININFGASVYKDWLHINAVEYNPAFDQIMLTCHNFGEIWVIDHSTTMAESAGHSGGNANKGGDLLYRWGNPGAYGYGTALDTKLWGPHNAYWIPSGYPNAGKIMIFNNRHPLSIFQYSSVEIIDPPGNNTGVYTSTLPYLPTSSYWSYSDSVAGNFYSPNVSGAQQLSNGNVLICDGPKGKFFEVDSLKNKVWEYVNPVRGNGPLSQGTLPTQNQVFRCTFYPDSYIGFNNQTLAPGLPIELNPYPDSCTLNSISTAMKETIVENDISTYPNPVVDQLNIISFEDVKNVKIINLLGQTIVDTDNTVIDMSTINKGTYLVRIETINKKTVTKRIIK